MALESAIYFVERSIAVRSGVKDQRYRIADGRFVLDNKDLSRVRFTVDEYINGLSGIEKVSDATAQLRIAQNGFKRGDNGLDEPVEVVEEEVEEPVEESEEPIEEPNETEE